MNTSEAALQMLAQASQRLETARRVSRKKKGGKAYTIRSSQECSELALKAALRFVGVDYPKRHDVGRVLIEMHARFPSWFELGEIAEESTWLAERSERAMYGSESEDQGPESLFSKEEALTALKYARHIYGNSKRLVRTKK